MEQPTKTDSVAALPQVRVLGRTTGTDVVNLFWTGSGIEFIYTGSEIQVEVNADYDAYEPWLAVELNGVQISRVPLPSKLEDPSLIIYAPVRVLGNKTIVTNGDQTDTIYELMDKQQTFEQALRTREFEPDAPNYTPRISGIMHIDKGEFNYAMSILKSNNGNPDACNRYTFAYSNPVAGEGHFIHTYMGDGNPLPSFEGEPTWVDIDGDIDTFTKMVWENLNEDNKVSLFVRFIDIETGNYESRIVNKNK